MKAQLRQRRLSTTDKRKDPDKPVQRDKPFAKDKYAGSILIHKVSHFYYNHHEPCRQPVQRTHND